MDQLRVQLFIRFRGFVINIILGNIRDSVHFFLKRNTNKEIFISMLVFIFLTEFYKSYIGDVK